MEWISHHLTKKMQQNLFSPYHDRFYIIEILAKNVQNKYHPAKSDEMFFKVGTLTALKVNVTEMGIA